MLDCRFASVICAFPVKNPASISITMIRAISSRKLSVICHRHDLHKCRVAAPTVGRTRRNDRNVYMQVFSVFLQISQVDSYNPTRSYLQNVSRERSRAFPVQAVGICKSPPPLPNPTLFC